MGLPPVRRWCVTPLPGLTEHFEIDATVRFSKLTRKRRELLLHGPTGTKAGGAGAATGSGRGRRRKREPFGRDFEGVIPNLRRRYEEGTWEQQEALEPYRSLRSCPSCGRGAAPPREPFGPGQDPHALDYVNLPIAAVLELVGSLELTEREDARGGDGPEGDP